MQIIKSFKNPIIWIIGIIIKTSIKKEKYLSSL